MVVGPTCVCVLVPPPDSGEEWHNIGEGGQRERVRVTLFRCQPLRFQFPPPVSGGSAFLRTNASKMVESIAHKNSLRIGREAVDAQGCGPDDKAACRTILWPGGPCAQIKVTYLTDCNSLSDNVTLICPHAVSHNKRHRPLIARTSPAHRPLIAH